jgi:hypothetical protein
MGQELAPSVELTMAVMTATPVRQEIKPMRRVFSADLAQPKHTISAHLD